VNQRRAVTAAAAAAVALMGFAAATQLLVQDRRPTDPALARTERHITREPPYTSAPKYGVLVLGPELKTRVWLVVDGDTLYVDRNGNGDLTNPGERVGGSRIYGEPVVVFTDEGLVRWSGRAGTLSLMRSLKPDDTYDQVTLSIDGKTYQSAAYHEDGALQFAAQPQEAPVIHFDGPLAVTLLMPEWQRDDPTLDVRCWIGTWGVGRGAFAALEHERVPANVHPVAEIEYPNRTRGAPPIRAKYVLKQRC
jgi:hypothetical protein